MIILTSECFLTTVVEDGLGHRGLSHGEAADVALWQAGWLAGWRLACKKKNRMQAGDDGWPSWRCL